MIETILPAAVLLVLGLIYYISVKTQSAINDGNTDCKASYGQSNSLTPDPSPEGTGDNSLTPDSSPEGTGDNRLTPDPSPEGTGEHQSVTTQATETRTKPPLHTRKFFTETLTAIGCQYRRDEHDRICFAFQGEHFVADVDDERPYVAIYDFAWGSIKLEDIDEVSRLRRAINNANWRNGITTMYSINDESLEIVVHCKSTFMFVPQIPDINGYLRAELSEFFRAHNLVGFEMTRLREKEEAKRTQQA